MEVGETQSLCRPLWVPGGVGVGGAAVRLGHNQGVRWRGGEDASQAPVHPLPARGLVSTEVPIFFLYSELTAFAVSLFGLCHPVPKEWH